MEAGVSHNNNYYNCYSHRVSHDMLNVSSAPPCLVTAQFIKKEYNIIIIIKQATIHVLGQISIM